MVILRHHESNRGYVGRYRTTEDTEAKEVTQTLFSIAHFNC